MALPTALPKALRADCAINLIFNKLLDGSHMVHFVAVRTMGRSTPCGLET